MKIAHSLAQEHHALKERPWWKKKKENKKRKEEKNVSPWTQWRPATGTNMQLLRFHSRASRLKGVVVIIVHIVVFPVCLVLICALQIPVVDVQKPYRHDFIIASNSFYVTGWQGPPNVQNCHRQAHARNKNGGKSPLFWHWKVRHRSEKSQDHRNHCKDTACRP